MPKDNPSALSEQAEKAKLSFQVNLSTLHDAASWLKEKQTTAKLLGKQGIFLTNLELDELTKWLSGTSSKLLNDYNSLTALNQQAILQALPVAAPLPPRCTCQHLIAADRFLTEWEHYKRNASTVSQPTA